MTRVGFWALLGVLTGVALDAIAARLFQLQIARGVSDALIRIFER